MTSDRRAWQYEFTEMATDMAVQLQELEWQRDRLSDEALAPEWQRMFGELRRLNERSLRESLQDTDPRALYDLVRYAKHLGMWKGYEDNQRRLQYVNTDEASDRSSE